MPDSPTGAFVQNHRGEFVPAIPLPLFIGMKRVQCTHDNCGRKFFAKKRYREHYALAHILALD